MSSSTISLLPSTAVTLTNFSFFKFVLPFFALAVHSIPWMVTWPSAFRLSMVAVTIPFCPGILSTLVFLHVLIQVFHRQRLVNKRSTTETAINNSSCSHSGPPARETKKATNAPPANQTVVSPSVKNSMTRRIAKTTSQIMDIVPASITPPSLL